MKTLDRFLAGIFLKNFAFASVAMTSLYLFQALFSDLLDRTYPSSQVVYYHLLNVPQIFVQMTPPAVLITTVLTLSGLNRTQELTALYSIGIGLRRIMMVLLSMVFMISCFTLVLQDRILPAMYRKRTTYHWREMRKRTDFYLDIKQNKIWYRSKNLIYNLRTFDRKSNTIHGMAVYSFDEDFNLKQVVDAERAAYTPAGWRLMNGTVTVFSNEDSFPMTSKFQEKELLIAETPRDFQEIEKEVDGLRLKELFTYIRKTKSTGMDTKGYEVKFHSRMSLSFIPIVMCILGVPFSIRNRREGGMAKDLGLCLGLTFFYWLFFSVGLSLGTNGALPPGLAAWLPSTIFAALAVALIARRSR